MGPEWGGRRGSLRLVLTTSESPKKLWPASWTLMLLATARTSRTGFGVFLVREGLEED